MTCEKLAGGDSSGKAGCEGLSFLLGLLLLINEQLKDSGDFLLVISHPP